VEEDLAEVQLWAGPWKPCRLPDEILCEIFDYYAHIPSQDSWTISQVCQAWRRAALNYPRLWSPIAFVPISWGLQNPNQYRYLFSSTDDSLEFIITPTQALRAVRRAGNALVDIIIIIPDDERLQMDDINDALAILGGQNTERWRTLSVKIKSPSPLLALESMRTAKFTSLKEVELYSKCIPLIDGLDASATSLQSLLIRHRRSLGLGDYAHRSWWGQLNGLTIEGLWREELEELALILEACPLLKDLVLHDSKLYYINRPYQIPSSWPPKITASTLVKCSLLEDSWRCLSGLAITELRVEGFGRYSHNDRQRTAVLPSVTHLICGNSDALFTVVCKCSFPSLITLELPSYKQSGRSKNWEDTLWAQSTLTPHRLVLVVVNQRLGDAGEDILDRLTSLEEAKLTVEDDRQLCYFFSRNGEFTKGMNQRLKLVECKVENKLDDDSLRKAKETISEVEKGRRAFNGGNDTKTVWVLKCNGTSEVLIDGSES
jgi:F-box-like